MAHWSKWAGGNIGAFAKYWLGFTLLLSLDFSRSK